MYSFEENFYNGNPYLELIIDSELVNEVDRGKSMKFGVTKAKMVMSCIDQIQLFCYTDGSQPPLNSEICIKNKENNIVCYCKKYKSFVTSFGYEVDRTYLKIWLGETHIGFGLEKAKGLLVLNNQIRDFINKYDH